MLNNWWKIHAHNSYKQSYKQFEFTKFCMEIIEKLSSRIERL